MVQQNDQVSQNFILPAKGVDSRPHRRLLILADLEKPNYKLYRRKLYRL